MAGRGSRRVQAAITKDLAGPATQDAPKNWLTDLLSKRVIDTESAKGYLLQSTFYKGCRWMLPDPRGHMKDSDVLEDEEDDDNDAHLQHRFMDIFNDILDYFGLINTRKVLATNPADDEADDNCYDYECGGTKPPHFSLRPDLALVGHDARYLPRVLDTYSPSMTTDEEDRRSLYRGCVVLGKVQRFRRQGWTDRMVEKVGTCARECFLQQPSRRFVFCFSFASHFFKLFLFDRNGAVQSHSLDIHSDAVTFVQAIRFLASSDLSQLGFDPSVYWENGVQYIDVLDQVGREFVNVKYQVDHAILQKTTISGRGTVCWGVRKCGEETTYVMKDVWYAEDDNREGDFLATFKEAGLKGVVKLVLMDWTFTRRPLSISSIRRDHGITIAVAKDRLFSRLVLEDAGPSIRDFTSGLQLLQALRAAIKNHCYLVKAGFLHRDISPTSILLGKRDGGPCGILSDFMAATPCERGKTPADRDRFIGPLLFRSVNNLDAEVAYRELPRSRHNFIDDLESFYWIYAWMIMSHNGPGPQSMVAEPCSVLETWTTAEKAEDLLFSKSIFLSKARSYSFLGATFTPYFSDKPYLTLHGKLRKLLLKYWHDRLLNWELTNTDGGKDFFPQIDEVYGKFLSLFDDAIQQLANAADALTQLAPPTTLAPERDVTSSKPPVSLELVLADVPPMLITPHPSAIPLIPTLPQPKRRIQPDRRAKRPREDASDRASGHGKRPKLTPLPTRPQRGLSPRDHVRGAGSTTTALVVVGTNHLFAGPGQRGTKTPSERGTSSWI